MIDLLEWGEERRAEEILRKLLHSQASNIGCAFFDMLIPRSPSERREAIFLRICTCIRMRA